LAEKGHFNVQRLTWKGDFYLVNKSQ
jgi:hypothetical protein